MSAEDAPLLSRATEESNGKTRSRSNVLTMASKVVGAACVAGACLAAADYLEVIPRESTFFKEGGWQGVNGALLAPIPSPDQMAGPTGPQRNVMVYDHCMSDAVKLEGFRRDFWTAARTGARIVRHNYATPNMFVFDYGVPLSRVEVEDGLYAWTLQQTRDFDFEYGVVLESANNWTFYEIGTAAEGAPLAQEPNLGCVQMYGANFNRVVTLEQDPTDISFVFGSCERECPPGYTDHSMVNKVADEELGSLETNPDAYIDLGESQDARLIIPATILLTSDAMGSDMGKEEGINPILRTGMQKDTQFSETQNAVRYVVGGIDYWRMYLKMALIEIYLENGHARMRFISQSRHTLSASKGYDYRESGNNDWRIADTFVTGCTNVFCDPMQYDLPALYRDSTNVAMYKYKLSALQYKSLKIGDSAPVMYSVTTGIQSEPNCKVVTCTAQQRADAHFLEGSWTSGQTTDTERVLHEAGTWGVDIDVRRLTINSGVLCSFGQNMEHCMFAVARAFDPGPSGTFDGYSGPTKTRKQYILASLVGAGWKLARVEVFLDNDAIKIRALDSALDHNVAAADHDEITGDALYADISGKYRNPTDAAGPMPNWEDNDVKKMGVGGLYYELAGTMVPSLTGIAPDQEAPTPAAQSK